MLKTLGCLLLIVTGTAWGITRSKELKLHTYQLKTVCTMLREVSELIRYRRSTTEEILYYLHNNERCGKHFEAGFRALSADEQLLLADIVSKLGTTDAEGQLSMIGHGISRFSEYAASAAEEQKCKCRLYEVLGFMAGAFAAVMFI